MRVGNYLALLHTLHPSAYAFTFLPYQGGRQEEKRRKRYNFPFFVQNYCMSNKKDRKLINEIFDNCASANECTGLFQRIHLDPEEIRLFHEMYNNLDGKDSIDD